MAVLPLKPVPSLIGAVVGASLFIVPRAVAGPSGVLILLAVYTGVVLVAYLVSSFTVGDAAGEFCRGLLIGATAAMNWVVASVVFPKIFGASAGTILAVIVALATLLAHG